MFFRNFRKSQEEGFTLIEMLIVVVIASLLFGVGVSGYTAFNKRQTMISAGQTVKNVLREVQSKALSGTKPETVNCLSPHTLVGYEVSLRSSKQMSMEAICSNGASGVVTFFTLPDTQVFFHTVETFRFLVLAGGVDTGDNQVILADVLGMSLGPRNWYGLCVSQQGNIRDCGHVNSISAPSCSC